MVGGDKRSELLIPNIKVLMAAAQFWSLVSPPDVNGCRDWNGSLNPGGYGTFLWEGHHFPAHELSLTFATGEVKGEDLDTCHSCDRRICCAWEHLRFDTRLANVADMIERGRRAKSPGRGRHKKPPNNDEISLIRRRRYNGATVAALAKEYGFSPGFISTLCRGVIYPDAPGPVIGKNFHQKQQRKIAS